MCMSLTFGQNGPLSMELAVFEHQKKFPVDL